VTAATPTAHLEDACLFWLQWALEDVGRADEDVLAALYDLFLAGEGGWRSTYAGLAAVSGRSIPDVVRTLEHLELAHYVHRAACSDLYIASIPGEDGSARSGGLARPSLHLRLARGSSRL